jgi:hypothetical protein
MRPSNEFPPEGRIAVSVELVFNATAKQFVFDVRSIRQLRQTMIVRSVWFDTTNVIFLNSNIRLSAVGFGSLFLPSHSSGYPSQGIVSLPCTNPAVINIDAVFNGIYPSGNLRLIFYNFDADPYTVAGLSTN